MPLVDANGNPVDPGTYPVRTPAEVGQGAKAFLKRAAAPIAAQAGGEMAGTALGAALAPETGGMSMALPAILGALGAGAANVGASKMLPKEYGGDPNQSAKSAFLWGAIPAGVGTAATKGLAGALAKRAAAGVEADKAAFEKAAGDVAKQTHGDLLTGVKGPSPTDESVRNIGHALGSASGRAAAPLEGEARTQATDKAMDMVLGPINRMRQKLGEPIGEAYKALKGNSKPIDDAAASDIAEAARNVSDDMVSPSPKAKAIFAKIRSYVPQGGPQGAEPLNVLQQRAFGTNAPVRLENTDLQRLMGEGDLPKEIPGEPPTLDQLREGRQIINERLRSAKGGDVHALLNLQQVIDKHLMDYLPEDIGAKRASYRGFIKNYDWRDLNRLRRSGTPEQVGDWLFSRDKSVVNEVVKNAGPVERDGYKQLFAQKVLSSVDSNMPAEAQSAALRKAMQPYMQNGATRALYGDATNKHLVDMIYLPVRRAEVAKSLASDQGKKLYTDSFMRAATSAGKADQKAAEAGFQAFRDSLPPTERATLDRVAGVPATTEQPVLPSAQESLASQLKPKGKGMYVPRFAIASGIGSAAALAMGASGSGGSYMMRAALGFGALAAGSTGYRAMMNAGGADLLASMYSSPVVSKAGSAAFKALVKLGARKLQEEGNQQQ